ncbi:MAG: hypothetical protein NVS9B10_23130 [Nevskia sp.]
MLLSLLALGACGESNAELPVPAHAKAAVAAAGSGDAYAKSVPLDLHILVDQFGYRPGDAKVAVIRSPQLGYDAKDVFAPGGKYQLRRADSGETVYAGAPVAWHDGTTQASSGDRGWWFDFSGIDAPGRYFVYDEERKLRSPSFAIDAQVYRNVLKAAVRMYFYQRSGFAKQPPNADACWADGVAYNGKNQDTEARDISDRDNAAKVRNLSGGWFDAGDTNKYVTFALQPVHQLLTAYQQHPAAFTDDFNIPESGNGIPDVLDEIKWETDWLKRMQYPDGSVALKVGAIAFGSASPPSSDTQARYYVPACTSATIAAAGMYAHAAYVYRDFPKLLDDAVDLKRRAIAAWNQYAAAPAKQTDCDNGTVKAGDADLGAASQDSAAAAAAIYLFALTGEAAYGDYLKQHYRSLQPYRDIGWSRYVPFEGEALLFYTGLPDADEKLRATILADKRRDADAGNQIYGFNPSDDLYRAFLHDPQYHWGSNQPRANYGNSNLDLLTYGLAQAPAPYRTRAAEILHWFHGVNPFAMVMLSNMYGYGATRSANAIFHTWFHPKSEKWRDAKTSICGPAPGYVPAGPNRNAAHDGVPATLMPPTGQPPQKSYRDSNGDWPESSYAITEPAIYFQSAYVKLLAAFADGTAP